MKNKIFSLAILLCIILSLSVNVQAQTFHDEIKEPAIGGKYYLCATVDGVDYYYRVTNSTFGESVTDTVPYSFYVTNDPEDKGIKEFTLETLGPGFYMGYPSGESIHKIYAFDVDKDDVVDTGLNSGLDTSRHCFYWDGENNLIFRMIGEEKYILVVKTVRNIKSGADELHMLCVSATELEGEEPVYPVRFVTKHICRFSEELASNDYSHWFPCACGEKKDLQLHQVESWTVTKEAAVGVEGSRTGECTVCGETAVEGIPALKDKSEPTETDPEGQETEPQPEEKESAMKLDPVVIVVASALVILGVVILIFGNKRKKK